MAILKERLHPEPGEFKWIAAWGEKISGRFQILSRRKVLEQLFSSAREHLK